MAHGWVSLGPRLFGGSKITFFGSWVSFPWSPYVGTSHFGTGFFEPQPYFFHRGLFFCTDGRLLRDLKEQVANLQKGFAQQARPGMGAMFFLFFAGVGTLFNIGFKLAPANYSLRRGDCTSMWSLSWYYLTGKPTRTPFEKA